MSEELLREIQKVAKNVFFLNERGEVIGFHKKVWDLFPHVEVIEGFRQAREFGSSVFQIEEGKESFLVELSRVRENLFLMKLTDITQKVNLSRVKRDLIAVLSHELKTPLTTVRGNLEYLISYSDCNEREVLEETYKKILELVEIISGLNRLVFGKREFEECNLKSVVSKVLKTFRPMAERKGIELKERLEEACVPCEKTLFEQLVRNLVDNAVKFTDRGKVEVSLEKRGDFVLLSVKDTGRGIAEDMKKWVFQKYFKSPDSSGSGIGLSVVREIVEHHGWEVDFESREGEGTVFIVRISLL